MDMEGWGYVVAPARVFKNRREKILYMCLLEEAAFAPFGSLKTGEALINVTELARDASIDVKKVRYSLKKLEEAGFIKTRRLKQNRGLIVTILNYEKLQNTKNYGKKKAPAPEESGELTEHQGKGEDMQEQGKFKNIPEYAEHLKKQSVSDEDTLKDALEAAELKNMNLSSEKEIDKFADMIIKMGALPEGVKKGILVKYLDCIRLTRSHCKISAKLLANHLEKMSKYSVDQLHYAMWTHAEHYDDKREKYTLGILRNTDDHKARQGLMKLMNRGGKRNDEQFSTYPKAVGKIQSESSQEVERLEALAREKGLSGKIRDTHCDF
ncbi:MULTISPECIES: winged helix-turn-helix domain-containing protein [Bacillus]|uniref:winged helix-turn-helix domain-containing protein n=1 Tax=Bacillus TaxID=1386 RepID=UPI00069CAE75|nr:winged helix-turn-helix domain-containing protein [Bacillus sp. TH008]